MHIKRSLAAVAITGATAAVLFGGTTVSTAFTSQSDTQQAQASGATTGVHVDNGNFAVSNLVPGDPAQPASSVVIHNDSSVRAVPSITFGKPNVVSNGTGGVPNLGELMITVGTQTFPASYLANGGTVQLPALDSGNYATYPVKLALAKGTGNDWNGAVVKQNYFVTMTAGN